jgi:hypothetical protein
VYAHEQPYPWLGTQALHLILLGLLAFSTVRGLSEVLTDTLERRAKMQGDQWDRKLRVCVMIKPNLSLTRSYKEKQKKQRDKARILGRPMAAA